MMTENIYQSKKILFNLWAFYYDCLLTTVFYQAIHQRLLEYVTLPKNAQVLDVGCGTGCLLNRLITKFPGIFAIGLDFSEEMLRQARQKYQEKVQLIFVSGNAEALPFAENQFHAVFNTISFLHYPHPEKVLEQVSRVLKPGGFYYLVDYTVSNSRYSFSGIGELKLYSPKAREQMAKDAGLKCNGHYYLIGNILLTIFTPEL